MICEIQNSINSHPLTILQKKIIKHLYPHTTFSYGRNINDSNEPLNNTERNQTLGIVGVKHLQIILEHFKKRFYDFTQFTRIKFLC